MKMFNDSRGQVQFFAAAGGLLLFGTLLTVGVGRADDVMGDPAPLDMLEDLPSEYLTPELNFIPTTPQPLDTDSTSFVSAAALNINEICRSPSYGESITIPDLLEPFIRDNPVCDLPSMILHCTYDVTLMRGGVEVVRERAAPPYRSDRELTKDEQKEKCRERAEIDAYEQLKNSLWGAGGICQLISLLEEREALGLLSPDGKNLLEGLRVGKVPVKNVRFEADSLKDSCEPIPLPSPTETYGEL